MLQTIKHLIGSEQDNGFGSKQDNCYCKAAGSSKMLQTIKHLIGSKQDNGFGSKTTAEEVTESLPNRLQSITAIITGATSGIGAETARVLAKRGAKLILPARNLKNAEESKLRILSEFPRSDIIILPLDLSSLSSVRQFVSSFLDLNLPLNLLINNAGKFASNYVITITEDGIENTFATNYLGHFLLTKLLLNKMMETSKATGIQGRIVNVSSGYYSNFSGDPCKYIELVTQSKIPYNPAQAYALSKLACLLHTKELARRLKKMEANVTVNCVNPGIVRTGLTREYTAFQRGLLDLGFFLLSKLVKTLPQAAATTCYAATHPSLEGISGKYFEDCNEALTSSLGKDEEEARRLWILSESMVSGLDQKLRRGRSRSGPARVGMTCIKL